jgi:hypothetical protein
MSTLVTYKTIELIFSGADNSFEVPYDEELLLFLKTVPVCSSREEDIKVFESYYKYVWPSGSKFWGFILS